MNKARILRIFLTRSRFLAPDHAHLIILIIITTGVSIFSGGYMWQTGWLNSPVAAAAAAAAAAVPAAALPRDGFLFPQILTMMMIMMMTMLSPFPPAQTD